MQIQTDEEHTGTAELTIIHYDDTELNRILGDNMKQPFQKNTFTFDLPVFFFFRAPGEESFVYVKSREESDQI